MNVKRKVLFSFLWAAGGLTIFFEARLALPSPFDGAAPGAHSAALVLAAPSADSQGVADPAPSADSQGRAGPAPGADWGRPVGEAPGAGPGLPAGSAPGAAAAPKPQISLASGHEADLAGPKPQVSLAAEREVCLTGAEIALTITLANPGVAPLTLIERPFVRACTVAGREVEFLARELMRRSDHRESRSDYVTLAPGGRFARTYHFIVKPVFTDAPPQVLTVVLDYDLTQRPEDNYYYDFEKEGAATTRKIPLEAWSGRVSSEPVRIVVLRKTDESGGLNEAEALAVAGEICRNHGWPADKAKALDRGAYWDVSTNWGSLGRNAFIRLDKQTGQVIARHLTGP